MDNVANDQRRKKTTPACGSFSVKTCEVKKCCVDGQIHANAKKKEQKAPQEMKIRHDARETRTEKQNIETETLTWVISLYTLHCSFIKIRKRRLFLYARNSVWETNPGSLFLMFQTDDQ